jgi:hypothetical protein
MSWRDRNWADDEHDDDDESAVDDPDAPDESDIDDEEDDDETVPCPHCRKPVYEGAELCPHCRRYLSDEDPHRRVSPLILTGAILALLGMLWGVIWWLVRWVI